MSNGTLSPSIWPWKKVVAPRVCDHHRNCTGSEEVPVTMPPPSPGDTLGSSLILGEGPPRSSSSIASPAIIRHWRLYILQNTMLPWIWAAENARCRRGVAILNEISHFDHRLPKRYIVTMVSKVVPVAVVMQDKRKMRRKK